MLLELIIGSKEKKSRDRSDIQHIVQWIDCWIHVVYTSPEEFDVDMKKRYGSGFHRQSGITQYSTNIVKYLAPQHLENDISMHLQSYLKCENVNLIHVIA